MVLFQLANWLQMVKYLAYVGEKTGDIDDKHRQDDPNHTRGRHRLSELADVPTGQHHA